MKILALDLATKTGWCAARAGDPVRVGTHTLPKTGNDIGTYLDVHCAWMVRTLASHYPDLVVYESPILRSGQTQIATLRKLYGLAGVTEMVCTQNEVPCFEVNLSTAKALMAGDGRAKKPDMIRAAIARGVDVQDDNQADAFAVFLCAIKFRCPELLPVYEMKGPLL